MDSSGSRNDTYKNDFNFKVSLRSNIACSWLKTVPEILMYKLNMYMATLFTVFVSFDSAKFKKIIGNQNFSDLFKRIVNRFKRAWYTLDIMRQTACLVFNPIMVEGYAALLSCTAVVQASDSMTASMCSFI